VTGVYPIPGDSELGGVEYYLVRGGYHLLDSPIPRDSAKNVHSVPATEDPFDEDGNVKSGYLYRYVLDALRELVTRFERNWPAWVPAHIASFAGPPREFDDSTLQRVVERLKTPRLRIYEDNRCGTSLYCCTPRRISGLRAMR